MNGPEKLDIRKYSQSGKMRLTGESVSAVVIEEKKYSQSRPIDPHGEPVSQPFPPLIQKPKKP